LVGDFDAVVQTAELGLGFAATFMVEAGAETHEFARPCLPEALCRCVVRARFISDAVPFVSVDFELDVKLSVLLGEEWETE
jgi:hypothetical protein